MLGRVTPTATGELESGRGPSDDQIGTVALPESDHATRFDPGEPSPLIWSVPAARDRARGAGDHTETWVAG